MDNVNVRDLLIRNGWKIVEAKENIELRKALEETEEYLDEVSQEWYFENQKRERLEKNCSYLEELLKGKDEFYEICLKKPCTINTMHKNGIKWLKKEQLTPGEAKSVNPIKGEFSTTKVKENNPFVLTMKLMSNPKLISEQKQPITNKRRKNFS